MGNMKKYCFVFDTDQIEQLREYTKVSHFSLNALLRLMLKSYLEKIKLMKQEEFIDKILKNSL